MRRGDLEAIDGLQQPCLLVEELSQRQLPPLPALRLLDAPRLRLPPLVELVVENLNESRVYDGRMKVWRGMAGGGDNYNTERTDVPPERIRNTRHNSMNV